MRETAPSAIVATTVTIALFGSVLIHQSGSLSFVDQGREQQVTERLQPVTIPAPEPTPPEEAPISPVVTALPPPPPLTFVGPGPIEGRVDSTGVVDGSRRSPSSGGSGARAAAGDAFPGRPCVGACGAGIAYTPDVAPLSSDQRDSVLAAFRDRFPALAQRPVPMMPEERDALWRERSDARAAAVSLGTHPPPIQSGVSIPVGLPFGGKSADERRRDSVVHADNLARLARLDLRADSLLHLRECGQSGVGDATLAAFIRDPASRRSCDGHGDFRE